jgi:hypothetical protein
LLPGKHAGFPVQASAVKQFWEFWLVAVLGIAVSIIALIAWTLK